MLSSSQKGRCLLQRPGAFRSSEVENDRFTKVISELKVWKRMHSRNTGYVLSQRFVEKVLQHK